MPSLSKRASTVTEGSKGLSVLPKRERLAAVDLIGRSFAGTADKEPELTVHWMIGPQLQEHDHPHRLPMFTMVMGFPVNVIPGGVLLGSRDENSGELSSVLLVRRQRTGRKGLLEKLMAGPRFASAMIWLIANKKIPKVYMSKDPDDKALAKQLDKGMNKRINHLTPILDSNHAKNVPSLHYYVSVMATDPPSQGKGHCSKLMRAVSKMADAEGVPCYLEASGEKKRAIYEHLGYRVVGQKVLQLDGEPEWKDDIYFMRREPAECATSVA